MIDTPYLLREIPMMSWIERRSVDGATAQGAASIEFGLRTRMTRGAQWLQIIEPVGPPFRDRVDVVDERREPRPSNLPAHSAERLRLENH